jgi:hypothetical protein
MLELLVASLCIGGFRCDVATKQYFVQNPAPKEWFDKEGKMIERRAKDIFGETPVMIIGTTAAALAQKEYQIKINRYVSIGKTSEGYGVFYEIKF